MVSSLPVPMVAAIAQSPMTAVKGQSRPELIIHYSSTQPPPTDLTPNSASVDEHVNTTGGYSVATLSTTDPDVGDTFTYSIVGGDVANFSIGGAGSDELILTDGILDFETKSTYVVKIRTTDAAGAFYEETLSVNVNDLNDAPVLTTLVRCSWPMCCKDRSIRLVTWWPRSSPAPVAIGSPTSTAARWKGSRSQPSMTPMEPGNIRPMVAAPGRHSAA